MAKQRSTSAEGLLGTLEYEVMRVLWTEAPANVPAVLARVNHDRDPDKQLAYTTVMTVLARLHDKGVLDRERRGRGFDYLPRFDEPALVEHLSSQEVADLLDRYGDVALAQFAQAVEEGDPKLLRRLRDLQARRDDA